SAGPAAWPINLVLGIRPLDVGCRTVEVKPFLGDLEWAEGALALPKGRSVKVRVNKKPDGSLDVKIEAPEDVCVIE
ncbi:MAG: alpha-L-rhamnosidase, partial [Kiritimatiellae bacterium]|nr:alpha-L-rhamnosidase [Kiritimatiellia bacterium]